MKGKDKKKPVPPKWFTERQQELQGLLDLKQGELRIRASQIEEELEAEFVKAWGLSEDIGKQAQAMRISASRACDGFDHCTFYYDAAACAQVIVSQPYADGEAIRQEMLRGLTLGNWAKPEIIIAPEWAFYYPGHATLIIIKFPRGFRRVLNLLDRLWSPAAKQTLLSN